MNNKATEVKSDLKAKVSNAGKTAKDTMDSASDKATDVLETVTEFGKTFLNSMSGSKEKAIEAATSTLNSLDKTVRTKPMVFIGGAAVLGFVAGYLLGRGRTPSAAAALKVGVDRIKDQIEKNINKVSEHLQ